MWSFLIPAAVSLFAANKSAKAASSAADSQSAASMAAIDLDREKFNKLQELFAPFIQQGTDALSQMQQYAAPGLSAMYKQADLAGLNGPAAQRAAIGEISSSPELMAMMQQGENAMLQNASATGGLRGGNLQGALSQFRPQMLNQAIQQRYGQLGGFANMGLGINQNLAQMGQASAAGVGSAGMQSAQNQGNLLSQIGAAQAGGALGNAAAWKGFGNDIFRMAGMGAFKGLSNPFGGGNMPDTYANADPFGVF